MALVSILSCVFVWQRFGEVIITFFKPMRKHNIILSRSFERFICVTIVALLLMIVQYQGIFNSSKLKQSGRRKDENTQRRSQTLRNFVTESETLKDPEVTDILSSANATFSTASLLTGNIYLIGQPIRLKIEIRDGHNSSKHKGGDDVTVVMTEKGKGASCSANVEDHNNGTYVAHLQALWTGNPKITVSIKNVREVTKIVYREILTQKQGLFQMQGLFKNQFLSEVVSCSPTPNFAGDLKYCNLTADNYGMSWYCKAPTNRSLICNDWTAVLNGRKMTYNVSKTEKALLHSSSVEQQFPIDLNIRTLQGEHQGEMFIPERKCTFALYPELWRQRSPIGFFYKQQWKSTLCRTAWHPGKLMSCLTGRTVLLFGDSTVRNWYVLLQTLTECTTTSLPLSETTRHKPSSCANTGINLTMRWMQHALPLHYGWSMYTTHYSRSIPVYLNEINDEENVIVIINVYIHLLPYHQSVYIERIHKIRLAVERLLQRNRHALVVIKSPHVFQSKQDYLSDQFAYLYDHIIREEFSHMDTRVVYMNIIDITIATKNTNIHPSQDVVKSNIVQIFSYICQK